MLRSTEALQQEIQELEARLQQARRALQELQAGGGHDAELELIELSESDIVDEPLSDRAGARQLYEEPPVLDPWAGLGVSVTPSSPGPQPSLPPAVEAPVWPGQDPSRDPLLTGTMAELYLSQGVVERALQIYRDILAVDPDNASVAARLSELESQHPAEPLLEPSADLSETVSTLPSHGSADQSSALAVLEGWLENIRRLRACR